MKVITIVAEAGISGFESPAAEYKELGLSLDQLIIKNPNATFIGQASGQSIWKETRLPVGVGFGETATLSKAANHAAKKLSGFNGVAVIDSKISRQEILRRMDVEDVWGVGRKVAARLKLEGINNAVQLSKQNPKNIRKQFSVVTERTVNELNGKCDENF